jgi:hypothetical protein
MADEALCQIYNANIGNGGESEISQALETASPLVSSKLQQDISQSLAGTTLKQDLQAQIQVTIDCALVKNGVAP